MSNFYARYVPPSKPSNSSSDPSSKLSEPSKRKRSDQDAAARESKRTRIVPESTVKKDDFGVKRFIPSKRRLDTAEKNGDIAGNTTSQPKLDDRTSEGSEVLDRYKVTKTANRRGGEDLFHIRRPAPEQTLREPAPATEKEAKPQKREKPKNKKGRVPDREEVLGPISDSLEGGNASNSEDGFQKHSTVREKFKKVLEKNELPLQQSSGEHVGDQSKPELHGLEPLPQPTEAQQPFEAPSYSTLPPWLATAERISEDLTAPFDSLGLSNTLVANLKAEGFHKTMPIQFAVISLLLKQGRSRNGDLAVAAATGSGKTLAYVLPMVEALHGLAVTKLRGLVVVPTRELVKQVQEAFNLCAEGTNLQVATALGSKSIKEEADTLIESYQVYDPDSFAEQKSKRVDWTGFSLTELFDRVKDESRQALDHVTKYRSKIDILVCTPGRLVEHLQTTIGFTLDDIEWLVIDEVDRLLNESYQEWLEVVMPALQSRRAYDLCDQVLQKLGMDSRPRLIQKVILSATMTQDLSKLNALNLYNPKLLTLESSEANGTDNPVEPAELTQDATGAFQMPNSLVEMAVMVGDGSDKPLHLLELFRSRIATGSKPLINGITENEVDAPSSESSTDSSSSSSGSDSDSESGSSDPSTSPQSNGVKSATNKSSKYPRTLIFTRSNESAPRLSRLLSLIDPTLDSQVAILTRSTSSSATSRKALKSFRAGTTSILITTDRAARGLDIPGIEHIINYDIPSSVQFYVHRVGRTARAGKGGKAWTLVAHREGRWFNQEIVKTSMIKRTGKIGKIHLDRVGKDRETRERYESALTKLGEEVEGR